MNQKNYCRKTLQTKTLNTHVIYQIEVGSGMNELVDNFGVLCSNDGRFSILSTLANSTVDEALRSSMEFVEPNVLVINTDFIRKLETQNRKWHP